MTHTSLLRLSLSVSIAVSPLLCGTAAAQTNPDVTFELRPHCVTQEQMTDISQEPPCAEYAVRDPLTRQTNILKAGDVLDMDLILHNPSARPLQRFRVWIGYDSNVLEGMNLALSNAFPVATPGEADFWVADNYVKLSGTSEQAITATTVVLARIAMKVTTTPAMGTALSFYDPSGTDTAHTGAFMREGGAETNVAATVQGSVGVRFTDAPVSSVAASSVAQSSTPTQSSASSVYSTAPVTGVFSKLQVQGLRITTEGSSLFLAWNPLPSAELSGYNVYYGTISGRYLQRRSVDASVQTLTIRALPVGQTYYVALRAVNSNGEESDYSHEVAVTIGNPATSTSPLSGSLIDGGPQGTTPNTGGTVAGDTGPTSWIALFLALSAIAGTILAFRRQWTASVVHSA